MKNVLALFIVVVVGAESAYGNMPTVPELRQLAWMVGTWDVCEFEDQDESQFAIFKESFTWNKAGTALHGIEEGPEGVAKHIFEFLPDEKRYRLTITENGDTLVFSGTTDPTDKATFTWVGSAKGDDFYFTIKVKHLGRGKAIWRTVVASKSDDTPLTSSTGLAQRRAPKPKARQE